MSEYNKTILTNEGIDLARRANKGTATFSLTRGVSSTDNLSGKTVEELQNLTTLPSIQQSVILNDVVNTTDNPDTVLGIRMTFNNQNLKTGYNVHTVGIYAKEPDKNEILYGIATAKTPEYIPDFSEQTLFKFDFLMYLVIGRTDKVTVEVSPDDVYRKKDTYNKTEIDAKVSDAVSKLNNKDAEILKSLNDYKQENNTYHQNLEQQISINFDTKADKTTVEQQLGTKADKANTYTKDEVNSKVAPKADKGYVDSELNKKADKATTYTKDEVNSKIAGQVKSVNGHTANASGAVTLPTLKATTLTGYDVKNKTATFDNNAHFDANGIFSRWPVDQGVIGQLADAINAKLPIEVGPANADLLVNSGNKIVYWNGNGDGVKNLPPMSNKQWFFAIKLFDPGWGSVTVVDQDGSYWLNTKNDDIWTGWRSVVTNEHLKKLKFVKQSLDQSGNTFQDTKFVTQEADGTFKINIFDSDWTANKVAGLLKNTYTKTEVDNKLSAKANALVVSQLADAINAKLPIEVGPANADLLVNSGNKIVYWNGNGDGVKNLPPMSNKQWFFAIKLFDPGWGSVTVVDQDGSYWLNTKNDDIWTGWRSVVTNEHLKKLKFVKQSLDQSGNTFQDTKFVTQEADGTFKINIFDSDWTANKVAGLLKNTYTKTEVDNKLSAKANALVVSQLADAINALNLNLTTLRNELMNLEKRVDYNNPQGSFSNTTVNINDLRSTGIYRLANCYIQNGPYPTNNTHWIYLQVTVFDANTVYQTLYEGDNMYGRKSSSPTNWGKWHKYLNQEV